MSVYRAGSSESELYVVSPLSWREKPASARWRARTATTARRGDGTLHINIHHIRKRGYPCSSVRTDDEHHLRSLTNTGSGTPLSPNPFRLRTRPQHLVSHLSRRTHVKIGRRCRSRGTRLVAGMQPRCSLSAFLFCFLSIPSGCTMVGAGDMVGCTVSLECFPKYGPTTWILSYPQDYKPS